MVSVRKSADGGVSPTTYVPYVTVDVRVHWPPRADYATICEAMYQAVREALGKVAKAQEGEGTGNG